MERRRRRKNKGLLHFKNVFATQQKEEEGGDIPIRVIRSYLREEEEEEEEKPVLVLLLLPVLEIWKIWGGGEREREMA